MEKEIALKSNDTANKSLLSSYNIEKILLSVKLFVFSIIPTALIFYSRSSSWLDNLQKQGVIGPQVDITGLKDILLTAGIILQVVLLAYPLGEAKLEIKRMKEEYDLKIKDLLYRHELKINNLLHDNELEVNKLEYLIQLRTDQAGALLKFYFKELIETVFSNMTKTKVNLNIRLFIPRKDQNDKKSNDKYFEIVNIPALADVGNTKGLVFKAPNQGVVGQCYKKKQIIVEDNLKNNVKKYHLTENQRSKTCNLAFCLCVPIFSNNGEVIAIVAYDSNENIPISMLSEKQRKEIIVMVTAQSQFLYDNFQELFYINEGES